MKHRLWFVFIIFIIGWGALLARGAYLQLFPGEQLSAYKKKQFEKAVTVPSRRGDILDRDGRELAVSRPAYSLFADPHLIEAPKTLARRLAKILKMDYHRLYRKLRDRDRRFFWVKRYLTEADYEEIHSWKIRGLGFREETKRVYPNGTLLSQVLGFVGSEDQGLEGLELKFDSLLSGDNRQLTVQRDEWGRPLVENGWVFLTYPEGNDLVLTIDRDLQFVLEEELGNAISEHEADTAVGVVLDAQTSEILAMASVPSFDGNRAFSAKAADRRNRAVTDAFEPGSTMKSFLIAAALKNETAHPNSVIDVSGGKMRIGRRTIREADAHHVFDELTVAEVLAVSSNVGTAKIALDLGGKPLYEMLKEFGFGAKTGVELPGETGGILHRPPWNPHLLANISFGHGVTATPLQIANAYAAVANGGMLRQPTVIKKWKDNQTGEWKQMEREEPKRVLETEDADQLRMMLVTATSSNGTGHTARIAGYPVAGKTGTAQKVDFEKGGYLKGAYISSFAGFAPAQDPRFVVYIAVDNPQKKYYGSQVAAPVFAKVVQFALRKEGYAPVSLGQNNLLEKAGAAPEAVLKRQKNALNRIGLGRETVATSVSIMPSLMGLTLREVFREINGWPLDVRIRGKGRVIRTSPEPGRALKPGERATIYLKSAPSDSDM